VFAAAVGILIVVVAHTHETPPAVASGDPRPSGHGSLHLSSFGPEGFKPGTDACDHCWTAHIGYARMRIGEREWYCVTAESRLAMGRSTAPSQVAEALCVLAQGHEKQGAAPGDALLENFYEAAIALDPGCYDAHYGLIEAARAHLEREFRTRPEAPAQAWPALRDARDFLAARVAAAAAARNQGAEAGPRGLDSLREAARRELASVHANLDAPSRPAEALKACAMGEALAGGAAEIGGERWLAGMESWEKALSLDPGCLLAHTSIVTAERDRLRARLSAEAADHPTLRVVSRRLHRARAALERFADATALRARLREAEGSLTESQVRLALGR
jgi:hypothetical protein